MRKTKVTVAHLKHQFKALVLASTLVFIAGCSASKQAVSQTGTRNDKQPMVAFEQKPGQLLITIGGQPFATYIYENPVITRPFFAHVKTPCGIQATRNFPPLPEDPQDHSTMHPGIWLSFGNLSGRDYWRNKAKIEHEMFVEQPDGGPGKGTFTVRNFYMSTDGKDRMLAELVKYTILVRPSGYLLVTNSTFSSESGDFTFGDQEEMGLGFRVNTQISAQYGKGQITNAEGMKGGNDTWGKTSNWIDYSGIIDNKYVGMSLMPDPDNFRPSWYHARDYGFIAANPFGRKAMKQGEESAITVKKGENFQLGFGILIHCNPAGEKVNVEQAYQGYLQLRKS